ncbi:dynein heavy chain [Tribonema minus]|uniref:Dynein heavy chain n=1 Tax=Tribonema minus TaxID=303371 RepID=A0A835Z350_9STRA|nr:dynein heavy chain [Tribonema minus]
MPSADNPCIAVIKRAPAPLDPGLPLRSQLQVMTFPGSSSSSATATTAAAANAAPPSGGDGALLSALQQYTRFAFVPAVASRAATGGISGGGSGGGSGNGQSEGSLRALQQRVRDLDVALASAQRRVEIPSVALVPHRALEGAAAALAGGARLDLDALGLTARAHDDAFLNTLQASGGTLTVGSWVKEIQRVTKLTVECPFPETALEEMGFWRSLADALLAAKDQLESPGVLVTVAVLKQANRFLATVALDTDTGLKDALEKTDDVNAFLKGFPIEALLSAAELSAVADALVPLFNHFGKVKASKYYSLERAAKLMESVNRALADQVLAMLASKPLMRMPYDEFSQLVAAADAVFAAWDSGYARFSQFFIDRHVCTSSRSGIRVSTAARCKKAARTGDRRLDGQEILRALQLPHAAVQRRLSEVAEFRERHHKFHGVIASALGEEDGGLEALGEVEDAYARLQDVHALAPGAEAAWAEARRAYERRVDRAEESAARALGERLRAARSAEEMFRAVARFSGLMARPRVRSAAAHHQAELLAHVRRAVAALADKFSQRYDDSGAKMVAGLRDIPPLSGKILWARQIERQLQLLMQRMEAVLGAGWEQHAEGRQLRATCDVLLSNLSTDAAFAAWLNGWRADLEARAPRPPVLAVTAAAAPPAAAAAALAVNYDARAAALFKELRCLRWLGVAPPQHAERLFARVEALARDAEARYPAAVALAAALRAFARATRALPPRRAALLVPYVRAVREEAGRAFGRRALAWDAPELGKWVGALGEQVLALQQKEEDLARHMSECDAALVQLRRCAYARAPLAGALAALQRAVDDMALAGYSNLTAWARDVETEVEELLAQRAQLALAAWTAALLSSAATAAAAAAPPDAAAAAGFLPTACIHTVTLRGGALSLDPPLQRARAQWVADLQALLSAGAQLPRLRVARFAVFSSSAAADGGGGGGGATYADAVLRRLPAAALAAAYEAVEAQVAGAARYAARWLQYQSLWELTPQSLYDRVGDDLAAWQRLLADAAAARAAIEGSDRGAAFGPLRVDCAAAQAVVGHRHDAWTQDLRARFAALLGEEARALRGALAADKARLEAAALSGGTREVVAGVAGVREVRRRLRAMQEKMEVIEAGEKLLARQRAALPPDWLQSSLVAAVLGDVCQVLARRERGVEAQLPALRARVAAEGAAALERATALGAAWSDERPIAGGLEPAAALSTVARYTAQLAAAREEAARLAAARDALGLDASGGAAEAALAAAEREAGELREVWSSLAPAWEKLAELKELAWAAVNVRKVRKGLDDIAQELRGLPNRVRQYAAHAHAADAVRAHLAAQPLLSDLRSDALKERHWRQVLRLLGVRAPPSELTLGDVWGADLEGCRGALADVVAVAQGEMALEEYLRQVRDAWGAFSLDLVSYQGRVRLIRGWDTMFALLDEHLTGLANMKQSPYFRGVAEFQEEAALWEDRLGKLQLALEVWSDVQRRWVYLEGIFFGSADIKAQLPAEHARFKVVDGEFVALMRRAAQRPAALEVLALDGLQRGLERQAALLSKVQSALGDHLARQRSAFSRFYFVGDDDLLEIVGGGAGEGAARHLGKMFAGIGGLKLSGGGGEGGAVSALAMVSKDGEEVALSRPVAIGGKGGREWLSALEAEMKATLMGMAPAAVTGAAAAAAGGAGEEFAAWCSAYPTQIVTLACQVEWCARIEAALRGSSSAAAAAMQQSLSGLLGRLRDMAESVVAGVRPQLRQKFEQLITEQPPPPECDDARQVHQRDVTRELFDAGVTDVTDFRWLSRLRFRLDARAAAPERALTACMADASFDYGYEYLGVGERLVQTPLTDRCYLTLTQALHFRMGGNPFGPAGTGKTESVKALGAQLGRFVLVFNCDETFDYSAMGRLFAGICQVGAWGCFDEFNRLEERILSAVSQQILAIQRGLQQRAARIDFLGRPLALHPALGIFITMNPGYAGRSNLPDNLTQLFRAVAMAAPDRRAIAQTMLFSQGIASAEALAARVVLLFRLCAEQLSRRDHYDFGLRALKSVLAGAGALKRRALAAAAADGGGGGDGGGGSGGGGSGSTEEIEREVLIRSICGTVVPKLVDQDCALFSALLRGVFPGCSVRRVEEPELRAHLAAVCAADGLVLGGAWTEKVLQLKQVLDMRHGVMLAGPAGAGKTCAWRALLAALALVDGQRGDAIVIDPKAMNKDALYGSLDPTTLEWTDGVFTRALRGVAAAADAAAAAAAAGDAAAAAARAPRRAWIVFDGDVDPEWAENLNSVLDDNRLLTLPSGERLAVPPGVRILLEVDSMRRATPATVSRCGMVWFSGSGGAGDGDDFSSGGGSAAAAAAEGTVTTSMLLRHRTTLLRRDAVETGALSDGGDAAARSGGGGGGAAAAAFEGVVDLWEPYLVGDEPLVKGALAHALEAQHIMPASRERLVETLFALLRRGAALAAEHDDARPDAPMSPDHRERFAAKWLLYSLLWGFGGSMKNDGREALAAVRVSDGEWEPWSASVPKVELEAHAAASADVVVTTTDTVRHVEVLRACLASHRPLILCGPPGSGKTMTLTSALSDMPGLALVTLSFSSGAGPALLLRALHQHCECVRTPRGPVLQPAAALGAARWLVVFCDEINLPAPDAYGTPRVLTLLRQLTERGGYWRAADGAWVALRRVQFVGACNPPTDPGRVPLPPRLLRHAPVLLVDAPARESLRQIYGAFAAALLRLQPPLRGARAALTEAMLDLYARNAARFSPDAHPQYVYSPRELSRWVRALHEAVAPLDALSPAGLVRLWAHEGLRLFSDRLVTQEERDWCEAAVDAVALEHFGNAATQPDGDAPSGALARPLLYGSWLSQHYAPVSRPVLRDFLRARLRVFYEEELDVPLVMFDEAVDHVLRIDRVLRQPMGHVLLVGESGVGKTVLSKFVAWMNGLSIFQIKAARGYALEAFDADLRAVMRRAGCGGERVCFIFDESNALAPAFLERMNALLASGEIPGLFEGDDRAALLAACREAEARDGGGGSGGGGGGAAADSADELLRRFARRVQRGLHVVFTMNPAGADFGDRCATSPALFNRCVVDWFGTWSPRALAQVGAAFTATLDLNEGHAAGPYEPPPGSGALLAAVDGVFEEDDAPAADAASGGGGDAAYTLRHAVVAALVAVHGAAKAAAERRAAAAAAAAAAARHFLSPRDYLDLIRKFVALVGEKRGQLEEQQLHINIGLAKLAETQEEVAVLRRGLEARDTRLRDQSALANAKLQQMLAGQGQAERRKAEAEALSAVLEQQNARVEAQAGAARAQLGEAEPALLAAQASVRTIKKAQLDEIRALARPPPAVKTVLEAVSTMLGSDKPEWTEVRKVIAKQDFISTVVHFDTDTLDARTIKAVEDIFTSAGDLDLASVNRASTACGPLYQWVLSQIKFSSISKRVQPLREEVAALQEASGKLAAEKAELERQIGQLQDSIAVYKEEYAAAIREIETIKAEMESVAARVARAQDLLASLAAEKTRWEATARGFDAHMATLVGDCLLAAAVVTIVDYLTRPAERLAWSGMGLPADALSVENAVILERFHRYPLVVDPSGQAADFLLARHAGRKIVRASFRDAGFMKTLASAVRFGTALLVQDVDAVDPILNPLLNRELQRTGGRTLVRIGAEDVDFSPGFLLVLATRDACARFPPDLCSRVTLVNFTATPASLRAQALGMLLRAERPDVDQRRTQVLQLQGEQSVRLRGLEDRLLDTISAVQGTILEDDTVVSALRELKREAGEVAVEAARTDEVMAEVRAATDAYLPLAGACARAYFAMVAMADVHFLYQFSLQFFLDILAGVLAAPAVTTSTTGSSSSSARPPPPAARLAALRAQLFAAVARRVTRGLLHGDKLVFALRLAQIYVDAAPDDVHMETLLKGPSAVTAAAAAAPGSAAAAAAVPLTDAQAREAAALCALPAFGAALRGSLADAASAAAWHEFLSADEAERHIPPEPLWHCSTAAAAAAGAPSPALLRLLLVRALRPDRALAAAAEFIASTLGPAFPWDEGLDLEAVACAPGAARGPIFLCSEPGQDASWRVDALAAARGVPLASVAMGAAEGFDAAERAVAAAARDGTWVLLRNLHLCPAAWLAALEQRLHGAPRGAAAARIFLTAEVHAALPPSLLRASELVAVGAPSGVRAALLSHLRAVPRARAERAPLERQRVYALLAWLHAVLVERLRYRPLGWARAHDFGEADAKCALAVADGWLDAVAAAGGGGGGGGKAAQHVAPEDIPWAALRALLRDAVYGGRVDNAFDQRLLDSFVDALFVPRAFDVDFALCAAVSDGGAPATPLVTLPDVTTLEGFVRWAETLPHSNSPAWLGLAPTAETALLVRQGAEVFARLLRVQDAMDEDISAAPAAAAAAAEPTAPAAAAATAADARLAMLAALAERWLAALPQALPRGAYAADGGAGDALHRCLRREVARGAALLAAVRCDLERVRAVARGAAKATNETRALVAALARAEVPPPWLEGLSGAAAAQHGSAAALGLAAWIDDLARRLAHLEALAAAPVGAPTRKRYWLGGLFSPEAFVTATRQHVAQLRRCSLESLTLRFSVGGARADAAAEAEADGGAADADADATFLITGLLLEGAGWDAEAGALRLSSDAHGTALGVCRFTWVTDAGGGGDTGGGGGSAATALVTVPLYLQSSRGALIAEVALPHARAVPPHVWWQRGVALVAWAPQA